MVPLHERGSADKLLAEVVPMVVDGQVANGVVVLDGGIQLPEGQKVTVHTVPPPPKTGGQSVLDIPPVSIGAILRPLTSDDDLLEEMLEGRL
jgi:hypothetical protein